LDNTGQPLMVKKTSYTVLEIEFGEESSKHIANEIAAGIRPQNWNMQGHPDYQMWIDKLRARQALIWDGQSQNFVFARVSPAQGPGIQTDMSVYQQGGGVAVPNPQHIQQPAYNTQQFVHNVEAAAGAGVGVATQHTGVPGTMSMTGTAGPLY
jgi:hypothetical protein